MTDEREIKERVREHYAGAVIRVKEGGPGCFGKGEKVFARHTNLT